MSNVNNPSHYQQSSEILAPIDICRMLDFDRGNMFKYAVRAEFKGREKEDLEKALWYAKDAHTYWEYAPKVDESFVWGVIRIYCLKSNNPLIFTACSNAKSVDDFFDNLARNIKNKLEELNGSDGNS